jgi:Na+/melibiose symporter-like transporter
VRLHSWFGKREAIMGAVVVTVIAASLPVVLRVLGYFPANGSPKLLPLLLLFVFIFYGAAAVLQISVLSALADVADEHELLTGRRQEGVFYAARTFFSKMTTGIGTILAGAAMDVIHFPHGVKPGQVADAVLLKLGLIDGPIASVPALIAIFFYARYRISKHRHTEIQLELVERRKLASPAAASDPPAPANAPAPATT